MPDFQVVSEYEPAGDQPQAIDKLAEGIMSGSKCQTLLGVTGSGKTEIYIRAIEQVIKRGGQAIVLVPEIALTPQTTDRFRSRFGNTVSVLHSGLSDGERFDEWNKIHDGRTQIVVGARSALFAPFRKLGLIVVDEEHETTYKQDEAPRYHARDVAVMRGRMENVTVVLGSATPSLESYYNCRLGKYVLAVVWLNKPEVGTIDIGFHPDSVKVVEINGRTVAVVAIENEPESPLLILQMIRPLFPMFSARAGLTTGQPILSRTI